VRSFTSDDLTRKLDLVDVLQRLGVAHHYKAEVLCVVYGDMNMEVLITSVTLLWFYLLRK
jgi:hypothetical protein